MGIPWPQEQTSQLPVTGVCRQLPLDTGDCTTCTSLPLFKSATRGSHVNTLPVWQQKSRTELFSSKKVLKWLTWETVFYRWGLQGMLRLFDAVQLRVLSIFIMLPLINSSLNDTLQRRSALLGSEQTSTSQCKPVPMAFVLPSPTHTGHIKLLCITPPTQRPRV